MSQLDGFFSLRTPSDLLFKLEADYARLCQAEPTSKAAQYAAFDFLVTAHHLADWSAEARGGALKEWRSYPDAALLGHIANGAKHFRVQRHHVAKDTEVEAGAFAANAFETTAFETGKLTIYLESGQAEDVLPLARRLLAHWRSEVADSKPAA